MKIKKIISYFRRKATNLHLLQIIHFVLIFTVLNVIFSYLPYFDYDNTNNNNNNNNISLASIIIEATKQKITNPYNKFIFSNIVFNHPKELFLNEEHSITLLVSNDLSRYKLNKNIDSNIRNKPTLNKHLDSILGKKYTDIIEEHRIKSSTLLEAQLTGQSFAVTSGNPVRQPITGHDFTMWTWTVEPKVKGDKMLTLTINAVFDSNGNKIPYTIRTFNKEINVKVRNKFSYWLKKNENLVIGFSTAIVTLLAVYFSFYLGKKSSEKKKRKTKRKGRGKKEKTKKKTKVGCKSMG